MYHLIYHVIVSFNDASFNDDTSIHRLRKQEEMYLYF